MKITVVGAGYVGLALSAVLADSGHKVWVIRKDKEKNEALKKGITHFYDPGLEELVKKDLKSGRLIPTTDYKEGVSSSDVVFICVGTPSKKSGKIDLSQVFKATKEIGRNLKSGFTLVVNKSTVPPGTTEKVRLIIEKNKTKEAKFEVAFCPEFLKEGTAIEDTRHPDRVIIGSESLKATQILKKINRVFGSPLLVTKITSAEMIKYAANNYLALRIVFVNQIADLTEKSGADIDEVVKGIGLDKRIGSHYWYPGLGYGGSCFPKDVAAFSAYAAEIGVKDSLFKKMHQMNESRIEKVLSKVEKDIGSFSGKTIGVLGLACKNGTDDIRRSPAIKIIEILLKRKAKIKASDPLAIRNSQKYFSGNNNIKFFADPYHALTNSDAIFILNDCPEFTKINFEEVKKTMKENYIFDSRNLLSKSKMETLGFIYQGIGR